MSVRYQASSVKCIDDTKSGTNLRNEKCKCSGRETVAKSIRIRPLMFWLFHGASQTSVV
jgi:hypothetical protein